MSKAGKRIIAALHEALDFMRGKNARPMRWWVPNPDGTYERWVFANLEEVLTYQKERERMTNIDTAIKGKMEILNPTGHTEVTWHADNAEEVAAARATFTAMTGQGYQAFRAGPSKSERGNRITEFDPSIERMILFPQLRGG
jgi:hypothetical protein